MSESAAARGYVIRGGQEGKRRLELISRTLWPTTHHLLRRVGFAPGLTCLDLGCGGGDVTRGIARMVGPSGRVVGVDMDVVKLDAAQRGATEQGLHNVEFRQANVYQWSEESVYDRIYSRFLLTHLPDCPAALASMRRALCPGGILVVEDIDFGGAFSYPRCSAYERYLDLYREVVRRRKGDADIGPKLYSLMIEAGLQSPHMTLVHPFHIDHEGKEISLITMANIVVAVLEEGLARREEVEETMAELAAFTADPGTVLSLPRIFQAWGTRAR